MKRTLCLILALALLAGLCACTRKLPTPTDPTDSTAPSATPAPSDSQAPSASQSAPTGPSQSAPTESTPTPTEPDNAPYTVTHTSAVCYSDGRGGVIVQLLCAVKNTGKKSLLLSESSFVISGSDGRQSVSDVSAYPQLIAPGETGYFREYLTDLSFEVGAALSVSQYNLAIREAGDAEIAASERYEIVRSTLRDSVYGGMTLTGFVQFTSGTDAWGLYVVCVLFDADDTPVGVMSTLLDTPQKSGAVSFDLSDFSLPTTLKEARVSHYEVYAYPILEH